MGQLAVCGWGDKLLHLVPCLRHENLMSTYQENFHDKNKVGKIVYNSFGKTGLVVSHLGLGTSELALCNNSFEENEAVEMVISAVQSGINYIDSAPYYGQGKSEFVLGKALKSVPRSTYYLATKVGRYGVEAPTMFDFSAARTLRSVEESLIRLGVDYIDVIQVHDLEFASDLDIIVNETLPALQKLKDNGKVKFIGVTGYPLSILKEVLERSTIKIDVVLSYCRSTLFDDSLADYTTFFKSKGVAIVNAAVLGMGLLTDTGPSDWHPANDEIKKACASAALYCQENNADISKLAACHSLSKPEIDIHLIGMQNKNLLKRNLDALQMGLSQNEKIIKDYIMERYFKPLSQTHWENTDVIKYWKEMEIFKSS